MRIRLIPALEDNYMYLLIDEKTQDAAVIDPVEPEKVSFKLMCASWRIHSGIPPY